MAQFTERVKYWLKNPHIVAMANEGLYLSKEAIEEFRVPLAHFLFRMVPGWATEGLAETAAEPRPGVMLPAPAADGPSPAAASGLRETVVAVLAMLAELGIIGLPASSSGAGGPPPLPMGLQAAPAPAPAYPQRPPLFGPRSAARQAIYDALARSEP